MMRLRMGYLSVIVCTAALGCGNGTGLDDPNVQISGTVRSAEDGTALEGIQVELWAGSWFGGDSRMMARSMSGPDGAYELETGSRPCDSYAIQAGWDPGDGYQTAVSSYARDSTRFSRSLACTDKPQVIDINLIPDEPISGRDLLGT